MSQVDPALRGRSRAALLLLCSGLLPAALAAQAPPAVTLAPAVLPAGGRGTAELTVADFGRYAIAVASPQGTALQVIDRMSGAGEIAGETGKTDGRLDLFLDRGTVRVVTYGSKLATGEARLAVTPFRERHAGAALRLVEGKPVDDELADFEQLSWWLEIPKRRRVVFEAAGRNLADLRLWQNGSWLVDAAPALSVVEPQSGRPLRLCQLAADLGPGLYRLTAYGGPELAWSKSAVERPFHLRFGWPRDAQTLRERRTVSAFGFDRALVSGVADFYRLELPEAPANGETTGLELVTLDEADPFATGGPSSYLTKENVPPVAEIRTAAEPERQIVVTVRGTAGQPYVLQHFARTRERELNARTAKSAYWVATVSAGPVGDAIDPTAILVRAGTGKPGPNRLSEVLAGETVALSRAAGWARRFNLLAPATVFVQVQEAGIYRLQSRGVAAQFRLEPLFLDGAPQGYEPPPARSAPAEWQLDPGYYRLAMAPVEGGIAEIELAAKGAPPVALAPPRPTVQVGIVTLSSKLGYRLYVSDQPGVESGLVVRELPLDLAAALPLALGPGEEIELPVRAAERSRLRALTEAGGGLELAVDGGEWKGNSGNPADTDDSAIDKGEHRVRVRSTSDATVLASIGLVSEAALAATPLPEIPAATLAALPDFPHLAATSSQTLDLEAGEARTFLVAADASALYRIESTGLLATAGALRTRTRANLLSQEENGSGRNFALAAYLREGDYQLTVRPRGASAGHLGLELARAPIEEGGDLALGIPARSTVDPRRALAFRLVVAVPGHYRFLTWGLRHDFPMRLEDADGWPVAAPLADGDLDLDLEPGDYRLIVLPQSVPARALVVAQREEKPQELSGHGPHALALDQEAANVWLEPEEGNPREADLWRFTLPAPTVVTIRLSDEMQGELRARSANPAPGSAAAILGFVPPGRELRRELAAGDYEIAATSSRQNNRLRYRVTVRSEDLVDGGARSLSTPGELTLAVGVEAQVELSSFGRQDVRATLMTALGEPIAASDDRPGDWNFLLSERLLPGRYRLRIDLVAPVDGATAATLVAMRLLRERTVEEVAADAGRRPCDARGGGGRRAGAAHAAGRRGDRRGRRARGGEPRPGARGAPGRRRGGCRKLAGAHRDVGACRPARAAARRVDGGVAAADLVARSPASRSRALGLCRQARAPQRGGARPRFRARAAARCRAAARGGGGRSRRARLLSRRLGRRGRCERRRRTGAARGARCRLGLRTRCADARAGRPRAAARRCPRGGKRAAGAGAPGARRRWAAARSEAACAYARHLRRRRRRSGGRRGRSAGWRAAGRFSRRPRPRRSVDGGGRGRGSVSDRERRWERESGRALERRRDRGRGAAFGLARDAPDPGLPARRGPARLGRGERGDPRRRRPARRPRAGSEGAPPDALARHRGAAARSRASRCRCRCRRGK